MKFIRDKRHITKLLQRTQKTALLKNSVMYSGCLQQSEGFHCFSKPVISSTAALRATVLLTAIYPYCNHTPKN
jgi:hypothetical protein